MAGKWEIDIQILEEGDIYFFYKPKKGVKDPQGLADVSRFYIVMDPGERQDQRYIVMGKKRMPKVFDGGEAAWGYIEKIGGRGFRVDNEDQKPSPYGARPIGEGIYAVITHRQHTHLLYELELPKRLGDVQKTFEVEKQGSYVLMTKHAWPDNPPETGRDAQLQAITKPPSPNQKGRFVAATPLDLRQEGAELLLLGATRDAGSLGLQATKDLETEDTADIFNRLSLSKKRHSTRPLMTGKWE